MARPGRHKTRKICGSAQLRRFPANFPLPDAFARPTSDWRRNNMNATVEQRGLAQIATSELTGNAVAME
jgi:hypothetical protein